MKNRHLAILAATAGIAVLGGYIVSLPDDEDSPTLHPASAGSRPLVSGLAQKAQDVSTVRLESASGAFEFSRRGDASEWVIANKGGYPADSRAVRRLIAAAAESKIVEEKTSNPDFYSRLGVDDLATPGSKSVRVSFLSDDDATLAEVVVGNRAETPSGGGPDVSRRFARRAGEAETLLVTFDSDVRTDLAAWADTSIIQLPGERVKSATFTVPRPAGEPGTVAVRRGSNTESTFTIDNLPEGRTAKDQYAAGRVAQALSFLSFEDVRPATEVKFDGPGVSTAEFMMFDGLRIVVQTVGVDGVEWHRLTASVVSPRSEQPAASPIETAPAANAEVSLDALPPTAPAPEVSHVDPEERARLDEEAEALNKRLSPWVFRLQDFRAAQMRTTLEDLLAPAAPVVPEPVPASPE